MTGGSRHTLRVRSIRALGRLGWRLRGGAMAGPCMAVHTASSASMAGAEALREPPRAIFESGEWPCSAAGQVALDPAVHGACRTEVRWEGR